MLNIAGVNYSVILWVDAKNGEPEQEFVFSDFYEMNSFIRKNKEQPHYQNCSAEYSLVETNEDGEIDAHMWTLTIPFEEFTESDIQGAIDNQLEWLREVAEHSKRLDGYMKSINWTPDHECYSEKRSALKEFAYVCPFCVREIEDCRCEHYPYYLMQIDRMILPVIRELNAKGYKTTGCCAGHPNQEDYKVSGTYICFNRDYDFDEPFPEGANYFKTKHCLRIIPPVTAYGRLNEFQQRTIWQLSDWAEMLSDLNFDGIDFEICSEEA